METIEKDSVLLVYDDADVRNVLSSFLESMGYKVTNSINLASARDLINSKLSKWHTLITDLGVPEIIRLEGQFERTIMISSTHASDPLTLKFVAEENVFLLFNPFPVKDLVKALKQA